MKTLIFSMVAFAAASHAVAKEPLKMDDEQQVGTRFMKAPESVDAQRARTMQKRIAHCIYDRDKLEAARLLEYSDFRRIDFSSLEVAPDKLFEKFEISGCIEFVMHQDEYQMYMRFSPTTMRNLLAEEAYLDAHPAGFTFAAGAPEKLANRPILRPLTAQSQSIADLEDCLTFNGAEAAHSLLRSKPASNDETDAFDALAPALRKCLGSTKGEAALSISLVRQMVADGMWSRAQYGSDSRA